MRLPEGIEYPKNTYGYDDALKEVAEEMAWEASGAIASALEGPLPVTVAMSLCRLARDTSQNVGVDEMVANPLFAAHGLEPDKMNWITYGTCSPVTQRFLKKKKHKANAKSAANQAGKYVKIINPAKLLTGVNATYSSSRHIHSLRALLSKYRSYRDMSEMITMVLDNKKLSCGHAISTAISSGVPFSGTPVTMAKSISKTSYKAMNGQKVVYFSIWLHFKAWREMRVASFFGGTSGPQGPASELFFEIFTRRGFTSLFGKHDVMGLLNEPCGWMALQKKMTHLE